MQSPSINSIDLNLLRVFDAVFREGHIARAARHLGMSQPAASHALARLRHALGDDLFVRTGQGMLPTARAEQLALPIRQALSYFELGLKSEVFDPKTSAQLFKIALDNCSAISLTSRIVETISRGAPGTSVNIRPSGTINIDSLIDGAELDLFIGRQGETRERFNSMELRRDGFVVVHTDAISTGARDITVDELIARPHLQLSSTGDDTSFVDHQLAEHGLERQIKHEVPLLACPAVLRQHQMLVVVRRPIAEALVEGVGLVIRELPFATPTIATCMRWHKRTNANPAQAWLRDNIAKAVM